MQEFGIKVSDSTGKQMILYFLPMSYLDWLKYSPTGVLHSSDPAVARYLVRNYITRAYYVSITQDGKTEHAELTTEEILDTSTGVVSKILESMFDKAGFSPDEEYVRLIEKMETSSRTITGSYDYFLFIHGGIDLYLRAIEMDAVTRAQIIMLMEKATGVSVKKRFDDSIEYKVPLDLQSDNSKYEGRMRTDMRRGIIHKEKRKGTIPDGTQEVAESVPPDTKEMIERSRAALETELSAARSGGKKRAFDWSRDEAAITGFEKKQDKEILNKELPKMTPPQFGKEK
jgi:hypothetical protein